MGYFGKPSFYKEQQEQIRKLVAEDLLLLTLQYLPHLRPQSQQDDYWELVAIKLNELLLLKRIAERHEEGSQTTLEDVTTMNGPLVREIFENEMSKTTLFQRETHGPNAGLYYEIKPRDRKEYLAQELKRLQFYDVEIISDIAKGKLREVWENELQYRDATPKEQESTNENTGDEGVSDTEKQELRLRSSPIVERARAALREKVIESLTEQINQRDQKMDKLAGEVKKLLELNHALVAGGTGT